MILIADSGSSKTDFALLDEKKQVIRFSTSGLSPFFVSIDYICNEINGHFPDNINKEAVSDIYFFGAGCSSDSRIGIVYEALNRCFTSANIEVNTDLYGAALAAFSNESGIVSILGTGSNTGLWDGNKIIYSTPSLGYILGDEGSGATLGKHLLQLLLNGDLPSDLESQFYNTYAISKNDILDGVYKKEKPNSFMASFTYFWVENLHHPFVRYTINDCFIAYFEKHVCKFDDYESRSLRCVGSIAHYFCDLLEDCALAFNIKIDKILRQPILGMVRHFSENVIG